LLFEIKERGEKAEKKLDIKEKELLAKENGWLTKEEKWINKENGLLNMLKDLYGLSKTGQITQMELILEETLSKHEMQTVVSVT
jgi:hypothetical protein